jgi:hypothetical protein
MKGLSDLRAVADALLQARLARLHRAQATCRATAAGLAAMDATRLRQEAELAAAFEAEMSGPVRDRWGAWEGARRATLNLRLAGERAEADIARAQARHAFGRAEALRLIGESTLRYPGGRGR